MVMPMPTTKDAAGTKESSANAFRNKYFTEYKTSSFSVFVLDQKALQKLGKNADRSTSEELTAKAGIVLASVDENKLVKGDASPERTVRAYPGKQPRSLVVYSDYIAASDGTRFYLYAYSGPLDVAPVVVGVPKERAAEFLPLSMDIFSGARPLTKDEEKLRQFLKGNWFWIAGQGLEKDGLLTYDTGFAIPNAEAVASLIKLKTGIGDLQQNVLSLQQEAARLEVLLRRTGLNTR